jgi:hypothetical protein
MKFNYISGGVVRADRPKDKLLYPPYSMIMREACEAAREWARSFGVVLPFLGPKMIRALPYARSRSAIGLSHNDVDK